MTQDMHKGSALDLEQAFEERISELSGITSSAKITANLRRGSTSEMMEAIEQRIHELSGVASCDQNTKDEEAVILGTLDPEQQDRLERYLHSLIGDLTGILNDNGVFDTIFDYDESTLYMTVSTETAPAMQYSIPFADLTQDFDQIDKDIDYIIDGTIGQAAQDTAQSPVTSSYSVDTSYEDELEQINLEAGDLVQRYMKGDESPYEILTDLGYKEVEGDFYVKAVDQYTRVFDFRYNNNDIMHEDYYCRYYVLEDDILPPGQRHVTLNLYDEALDSHHLVDEVVDETVEGSQAITAGYTKVDSKQVLDSDGFYTDYTWYRDEDGLNVFVLGDNEVYGPEEGYFDWEEENDEAAQEWFDSYNGFADEEDDDWNTLDADDIYSCDEAKQAIQAGAFDRGWYFGKEEADLHGDMIVQNLSGKTVSKRRDKAEEPGGLIYEANQLGIDMWDLLRALEGMCYQGRAREIDDSTYLVLGS